MTRRLHILIAGCAAAVAVAEWLHGNAGSWAWTAGVAGLATAGLAVVRGPRTIASGLAALASLLLGVVVVAGVREVRRIECCWTEVRAELVPRDSAELRGALAAAVAEARRLAARGMRAALLPRDAAFEQLEVAMEARGQAPGVERGAGRAGAALAAALLFLFMVAPPGRSRWLVVLAAAWCLMRAPLGSALGLASLFSSALFYRPMLGMFSASAGSLVVLGLVLLLAAALRWRGGVARRWWSLSAAAVLVLAAPYVVRYFGRGIAPPAGGVSFGLWISWQLAVAAASMALVVWAAALVRGTAEPRGVPWTLPAACAWAVLAALAGLWLWQPYGAWPEWYTFVWLPALVGVVVPAPTRWAVCGIATVAGTAAALVTWGAAVEGRLGLAERDAAGLGRADDPPAVALLERMGHELPVPAPRTAGELYALWLKSPLAGEDYPASLAVWTRTGDPVAELRLARLDLRPPLMAALVHSPDTRRGSRVERLERVPGVHNVLVAPLASGDVLTVGVGPRTLLIAADRVARFLQGDIGAGLPYVPTLSLPSPGPPAESARVIWTRTGWSVRGERRLEP